MPVLSGGGAFKRKGNKKRLSNVEKVERDENSSL